ncbi:anti-sigma factor [Phaeodactylibacter luteus]|uniref:anti-sigma factor n=1 Tax=Phaeodactylibacter luteus TaxID=1564516 RepID=UPI00147903C2|nr:anti-sigma factor [Phaeodactylibacter luteus]
MDPKSYIASGILEQYVLGKLSTQEVEEVERYASQYPEIRQEIDAIEEALQEYALLHGKTPPPGVLSTILQTLDTQGSSSGSGGKTVPLWAFVAAAALFLGSAAGWYLSSNENAAQSQAIASLGTELDRLQSSCDSTAAEVERLQEENSFLSNPDTRTIYMEGTDLSPTAIAAVFYNVANSRSYLNIGSLPEPPTDKQYQLWAIVDGQPVDMGVFEVQAGLDGVQEVPFVPNAQAFAVTLEPRGGSQVPTLDQMYVVGNVS